jgi:hypothetical protein
MGFGWVVFVYGWYFKVIKFYLLMNAFVEVVKFGMVFQ